MADDWRVTVTLSDGSHANRVARYVRERQVSGELHVRLGHRIAVSVDGPVIYLYAGTEDAAREADRVVRDVLAEHDLTAGFALDRWHPDEQDWQDASIPLPQTAAERRAEHQRLIEEETRESLASGQAGWDVQVEMPSRHEAAELAERLRAEGRPVIRRWRYLVVGANNEDEAARLAQAIKESTPSAVAVLAEGVPFASFGHARG